MKKLSRSSLSLSAALLSAAIAIFNAPQSQAARLKPAKIPLPAATKAATTPVYSYDCGADGFCEALPNEAEPAAAASSAAEPAPRMALASDLAGEAAMAGGDPFAAPATIPPALAQSFAIQGKLRDVETYLGGFRTQVGIIAADQKVSISSRRK